MLVQVWNSREGEVKQGRKDHEGMNCRLWRGKSVVHGIFRVKLLWVYEEITREEIHGLPDKFVLSYDTASRTKAQWPLCFFKLGDFQSSLYHLHLVSMQQSPWMIPSLDQGAGTDDAQWTILRDLKQGKLGKPGRMVPKQENLITIE